MASLNAQIVAQKVSESIRTNRKVVLGEIIRDSGYAITTSLKPKLVTNTKSYKSAIMPLTSWFESEIKKINEAIEKRDFNKENFRTLIYTFDIMVKNYQLLSGGAIERQVFVLPSEIIERNDIKQTLK